MTDQTGDESLELEVRDFGPIIEAKVDLRPLTVFVGPSNTGKSYLAILIYGLHRMFGGGPLLARSHFRRRSRFLLRHGSQGLSDENIDALYDLASSFSNYQKSAMKESIALPPLVGETLGSAFSELAGALSDEIARCFGVGEVDSLIRRGQGKESVIVMRKRIPSQSALVENTITLARNPGFKAMMPEKIMIPDDLDEEDWRRIGRFFRRETRHLEETASREYRRELAALDILPFIGNLVLPSLIGPLRLPAFYLPADRTGIMHAHSVVVSALIASAPVAGLRPAARTPTLSGVLADFLEQLIGTAQTVRPRQGARKDLGRSIEDAILDGSVRVDRSAPVDYPRFAYRPRGWKDDLPLANASSMVSELAPVVLYLRHVVELGDVLVIEEPESHLHPAMQVAFTRQLAALIDAGVRVIVTTHSEWLLEELANIVRRSRLPRADRGDNIALRPDQVGVWLFQPKKRPRGSVVKEIGLGDLGLYPSGFDDVASALHNDWADTESRIGGGS